ASSRFALRRVAGAPAAPPLPAITPRGARQGSGWSMGSPEEGARNGAEIDRYVTRDAPGGSTKFVEGAGRTGAGLRPTSSAGPAESHRGPAGGSVRLRGMAGKAVGRPRRGV